MSARHAWKWTTQSATLHVQQGRNHRHIAGTVDRCRLCGALRRMTLSGNCRSYSTDGGTTWTDAGAPCPPCREAV